MRGTTKRSVKEAAMANAMIELMDAAQAVIDETNRIHDNSPWPQKYRAPYGAIVELGRVLAKLRGAK